MTIAPTALDETKLNTFVGKMLGDIGATISAALVVVGDRTGLYRSLDQAGPATAAELAARTQTDERYVREWLANQAASGYLDYDAATERFSLPPEHAMVLARDESPVNMQGLYEIAQTLMRDEPKITRAFRDGSGVGWHEHDEQLYPATARFFRPGYVAHLVSSWIPALDGVEEKLRRGAAGADVGCGHGTSTIIMAQAYPNSTFRGFDYHATSIDAARAAAGKLDLGKRLQFAAAGASTFDGGPYDFVACFDCIHDMGDPEAALAHIRSMLAPDGTLMIVEPFAHDEMQANFNAIGRIFYGCSTMLCTPSAKSQAGGYTMGAQAGEARMRAVAERAGFARFRRAAETPFNIVYEARP